MATHRGGTTCIPMPWRKGRELLSQPEPEGATQRVPTGGTQPAYGDSIEGKPTHVGPELSLPSTFLKPSEKLECRTPDPVTQTQPAPRHERGRERGGEGIASLHRQHKGSIPLLLA